jgi:aryl-alcohol dehydrogenase-like predicted oxidoreductase
MEQRELGRSGFRVSRVILGCGNFGGIGSAPAFFGQGESEEEAFAIMDAAWELGITAFDTADAYGGGRSETAIGKWLRSKSSDVRDRIVITTKTFNPMQEGADRGLSRARILRQIDTSLERLGLEGVPLYMAHAWDTGTPIEETLRAFDEAVRAGKVGAVGGSNVTGEQLAEALEISELEGLARYEWAQNAYSLLERTADEDVLPVCREHGLGFAPFGPLSGGWLAGRYRRDEEFPSGSRMATRPEPYLHLVGDELFAGVEALATEARERGISTAGLALAWVLSHPDVTAAVVGPRKPEHLDLVTEALSIELTPAERDSLAALFR